MAHDEPTALGRGQLRLWHLITEPEGIAAALAAQGDAGGRELEMLVCGDGRLSAGERLSVYANAYFARIHYVLQEDFGALSRALGQEAFHDLVKTYLLAHPPARPWLREVGARLPAHLATPPFAGIFGRRCPFAADLARLEWALCEAFFAADAPVLAAAELTGLAPDAWPELRFETTPSLKLLACEFPVHELRERFDADAAVDEAAPLAARPTQLRIHRSREQVLYREIDAREAGALRAAAAGASFGEICDGLATLGDAAEAAGRAAALLRSWLAAGLLARLR